MFYVIHRYTDNGTGDMTKYSRDSIRIRHLRDIEMKRRGCWYNSSRLIWFALATRSHTFTLYIWCRWSRGIKWCTMLRIASRLIDLTLSVRRLDISTEKTCSLQQTADFRDTIEFKQSKTSELTWVYDSKYLLHSPRFNFLKFRLFHVNDVIYCLIILFNELFN